MSKITSSEWSREWKLVNINFCMVHFHSIWSNPSTLVEQKGFLGVPIALIVVIFPVVADASLIMWLWLVWSLLSPEFLVTVLKYHCQKRRPSSVSSRSLKMIKDSSAWGSEMLCWVCSDTSRNLQISPSYPTAGFHSVQKLPVFRWSRRKGWQVQQNELGPEEPWCTPKSLSC